jgi:uncharacterized membrane protein HdeD (DUF308 family)
MEPSTTLVNPLVRNWSLVLLRGLAGIIFGIVAFLRPGVAVATLILVFGAYAFLNGVLAIVALLGRREGGRPWPTLLVEAIVSLAAGLIALFRPGITAVGLLVVAAAWAFLMGIFEIMAAIRLRKLITGEWMLALSGVFSVALSVLLVAFPKAGLLTMIWWIGAYAIVFGVTLVALGLRLRSVGRSGGARPVGNMGAGAGAGPKVFQGA